MFYTGASHRDDGLVQRIGAASSLDLISWTKHPHNPLVEADPRWYEMLNLDLWHDQAWRDPWVYPVESGYEMLVTARANEGPALGRGVIGRATSPDLAEWTIRPPITTPGRFGHMEVPQREAVSGRNVLFFSCGTDMLASRPSTTETGCYALILNGSSPQDASDAIALATANLYSTRIVLDPSGDWVVLGFELQDGAGGFAGRISDPIPLRDVAPALFEEPGEEAVRS
jgi:beta-fructofuranosidase